MSIRVADYISTFLQEKKIKHVFLLSGGGMMHLLDAVARNPQINYVCNHHEQASAMAAEAYARYSGDLGVCYATSGPGATNILTGLVGAWQDSTPVLFITGQSKLSQTIRHHGLNQLRQFGTFEVDIVSIVQSVTKYAVFLDDPSMIKYHLQKAYTLAMGGRPGPVLIDIPVDIQGALVEPETLLEYKNDLEPLPRISSQVIEGVLHRLMSAKRPLILAGHGIRMSNCMNLFHEVICSLNMPVVTTQLAKDIISYNHPLFVGHPGMKGDRAGNFAVQSADVILSMGCSLHTLTTGYELDKFAPHAYKIQVEIDENILTRSNPLNINKKINCDIKTFLTEVRKCTLNKKQTVSSQKMPIWQERCLLWKEKLAVQHEPHQKSSEVNYYEFVDAINQLTKGDEVIITDAGSAFYVVGQALHIKKDQRLIVSGALGAMGYALPAATGACLAASNKQVICITGDGSLQTNVHELATIVHHKLNIKLFIINNDGYISIQNTQKAFFNDQFAGVDSASGITFPNLQKLAESYGMKYQLIPSSTELLDIMTQVLSTNDPILCEVLAIKDQAIIPTVTSQKLDDGKMVSRPLEDMFPFMDETVRLRYLNTAVASKFDQ